MPFRKLILPFTLTDSTVLYYNSFAKLGHGEKIVQSKLKSAFNILILTENNSIPGICALIKIQMYLVYLFIIITHFY